jgi:hypothetical protein
VTAREDGAREALLRFFSQNGLLLCNESSELPYLELVGGDWNAIVSLLESGDACYSRFYKNRVTYLSPALYFALKSHRQREERLTQDSARLLAFLRAAGEATTQQMQAECMLEKKALTQALNLLVSELLVTVLRRDVTLNETWCSFTYGPAARWEEKQSRVEMMSSACNAEEILLRQLSQNQIASLLK